MPALKRALARPLRAITWGGVLLGVLLVAGLTLMLVNDHHRRLEAAQRQSRALAVGSERLLALELRNLERAMSGIAADAAELFCSVPAQAPALLDASIGGVLRRHAELHSIVVLDSYGRALTAGKGDLQLPLWTDPQRRGPGSALYIGPPQRASDGAGWSRWRCRWPMGAGCWHGCAVANCSASSAAWMSAPTDWSRSAMPRATCWPAYPIRMARWAAAMTCRAGTCSARRQWSSWAACPASSTACRASSPSARSNAVRWRYRSGWPTRTCWHPGGRTCRPRWRSCWPTSWCCWCCCTPSAAVPAASRRWPRS